MAGRNQWSDLRAEAAPETRERAARRTAEMLDELPLHELRQARRYSQETLAQALGTNQAGVSKMERRTDMYLSTLRRYIEAMGGDLEITARFPEGSVRIRQFEDLTDARLSPADLPATYARAAGGASLVHERRPPLEPDAGAAPADAPPPDGDSPRE